MQCSNAVKVQTQRRDACLLSCEALVTLPRGGALKCSIQHFHVVNACPAQQHTLAHAGTLIAHAPITSVQPDGHTPWCTFCCSHERCVHAKYGQTHAPSRVIPQTCPCTSRQHAQFPSHRYSYKVARSRAKHHSRPCSCSAPALHMVYRPPCSTAMPACRDTTPTCRWMPYRVGTHKYS